MTLADLQAWLTAIGTVIGAIGTVGAFAVALYLLSIQMRDRRADAQERLLGQARLVAAWIADISEQPYQKDGDPVFYDITVHAYNASTEPVYNVVIKTEVGVRGSFVRRPFVLGPGDRREFSIVAPGSPRGQPAVAISFVDSAGRQWMRRPTGTLHQPLPMSSSCKTLRNPALTHRSPSIPPSNQDIRLTWIADDGSPGKSLIAGSFAVLRRFMGLAAQR